jgi:mycoredoxin
VLRRWKLTIFSAMCGVLLAATQLVTGSPAGIIAVALPFVVPALLLSPWAFPRSLNAAQARDRSARDGRPIVYWRPGCRYCLRLRLHLGRSAHRMHWVDIWADPVAAAAVRAVADGDETVPTVVIAEQSFVNPDPRWLRNRLLNA